MVTSARRLLKFVRSSCRLVFGILIPFCLASPLASAQTLTTGDIAGTVTDAQGAVIGHAQVTATNEDTGAVSKTESTATGGYHVPLLVPGHYSVTSSHAGFEMDTASVLVSVAKVAQANFAMRIGSVQQTVHVTSAAPLLDTENGDLTTTFDQKQLESIPNPGNDVTFVGQLAPGSVMNTAGGTGNFSSYGLPATSNNMTINGASIISPWSNTNNTLAMNMTLGNNELAEATVVTNAYSVQYGGLGGAQLVETTRAGTNQFHGNVALMDAPSGTLVSPEAFLYNGFGELVGGMTVVGERRVRIGGRMIDGRIHHLRRHIGCSDSDRQTPHCQGAPAPLLHLMPSRPVERPGAGLADAPGVLLCHRLSAESAENCGRGSHLH